MDIQAILDILPHRYPMLLVDRAEITEPGKRIIGIKNVTINEPFFMGHFPGEPIMPGVLIIETGAQVGAIMFLSQEAHKGKVPLMAALDDVRFRRPVRPGDQLRFDIELLWMRASMGCCRAEATVDGEPVCSFKMSFMLRAKEPLAGA